MVSSLHPDKAQLEPVGFPTFSANPLDEFRSSLYPLFSFWFRLGHNRILLKIIFMGTTRNSLMDNGTVAYRSTTSTPLYLRITSSSPVFLPALADGDHCLKVFGFPFLHRVTRSPFRAVGCSKITKTAFQLARDLPCRSGAGYTADKLGEVFYEWQHFLRCHYMGKNDLS